MNYHPRIETNKAASFLTTRSRNSELWFVNNDSLEQAILGYVAKFGQRYSVVLHAIAIEGNHIQMAAQFPLLNRSNFMRDLNSCVARAIPRFVKQYPGGSFWGRRYSAEVVPFEDIEKQFFYTVLQTVQDGLVERISDYPGYNCFHDAVYGIKRKFPVINWTAFNNARRHGAQVALKDFIEEFELEFARVPGYEGLEQKEYAKLMHKKLEEKRVEAIKERGIKGFVGREKLLRTVPGQIPKNTKRSQRYSFRPRVLSSCPERRKFWLGWYFGKISDHREASQKYRNGDLLCEFPEGMYKPYLRPPPPK